MLHKGEATRIKVFAGKESHAPEWKGINDHWPIWSKYAVHNPAQKVQKQAGQQNVRWEFNLINRQNVEQLVECMEKIDDNSPCPTVISLIEAVKKHMRSLESHAVLKVKQLYRRAD